MTDVTSTPHTTGRRPRYSDASDGAPTLDTWQDAPHNRWALAHVDEFVPTVSIARNAAAQDARQPSVPRMLDRLLPTLDQRLQESFTDAFLVITNGGIVDERYTDGFAAHDKHLLMSVSKSICGLTVGTLVDEGLINVHDRVDRYVPELVGSAYGDATVQQVLDMTVDVDYDENYLDPASHVRAQDRVAGWRSRFPNDPTDTYEFLASLRGGGRHGKQFQYCSAGTDVLAWIVENVSGSRYAEAVSAQIWSRLGCQDDASITVDPGGFSFANGGISCTARDLARVGLLVLNDGVVNGERIVSEEWIRRTHAGGDRQAAEGTAYQRVHPQGSYRNQWWVTGNDRANVYAVGIHGQYIWVDRPSNTVIVKFSSWPEPVTEAWNRTHAALFREVCEALDRPTG